MKQDGIAIKPYGTLEIWAVEIIEWLPKPYNKEGWMRRSSLLFFNDRVEVDVFLELPQIQAVRLSHPNNDIMVWFL